MNEYPALRQLIKAYFDEDWSEESGGDPRAVLTMFAVNEPDLAPRLRAEIDALLSKGEGEAAAVVRSLGPYYDVEGDGLSYAAWLMDVRQEVTRVLDHG